MKRLLLALVVLLGLPSVSWAQQQPPALLWCFNSTNPTTQPCPGNKNTTNGSVTIATGNSFQTVLAASFNRASLTIENNNSADNCWVFVGGGNATKAASMLLLPGGSYTRYFPYVPADAIQATCATTSDTLYVDTQ